MDWNELIPAERLSYSFIMGNPPFVGAKFMSAEQRADALAVFGDINNAGLLDFVAAWHVKAARLIRGTAIRCAFVSTNSICQGEQVGVLWNWLLSQGCRIFFAHRTFQWNNEARGKAAVHCIIVGFACEDVQPKLLFEYEDIRGEAQRIAVNNINPYLVDASDVVVSRRTAPICSAPHIGIGNQPIDGGYYLFTEEEKAAFIDKEPQAAPLFRRWLGADEFLNGYHRYYLWLGECSPTELKAMPEVMKRLEAVKRFRLTSKRISTKKLAETPTRFQVENMPKCNYLVIPEVSSERRYYIPIGFETPETLCSNRIKIVSDAGFYHFGILHSAMHMAWVRTTCGRLKSDYCYSAHIVYNNFPWPENPSAKQRQAVEAAAQAVLDARAQFPAASLADLYDPLTMPPVLLKAHQTLDRAADAAYGKSGFKSEAERVAFLFDLHQKYTASLLPLAAKEKKPGRRKKTAAGQGH
jgi:hypothetical protein